MEQLVEYPDCDDQPRADNTTHWDLMTRIYMGLTGLFLNREDVFFAADLLWYPVHGRPDIRTGPDIMVAFGRPNGHRGSYKQWEEGGVTPQVIMEILTPTNRENAPAKFEFYQTYGVEEYYTFDHETAELSGFLRVGKTLEPIPWMIGHISPRLDVRFDVTGGKLFLYDPSGWPFMSYVELVRFNENPPPAEVWALRRESERHIRRANRYRAQLRALGIDPDA